MSRIVLVGFVGSLIAGGVLFLLLNTKSAPLREEPVAEVAAADDADDPDVEFLKRMGLGTDGSSLIKFLEDRSPTDIDPDHLEPLIRQLGEPSFEKLAQRSGRPLPRAALAPDDGAETAEESSFVFRGSRQMSVCARIDETTISVTLFTSCRVWGI